MCAAVWHCDFLTSKKIACYLLRTGLGWSSHKIRHALHVNHQTLQKWVEEVEDRRDDTVFDAHLTEIEDTVRGA